MGISKPGRDTSYDNINDSSSDEEKLDVVLKILFESHTPIWLDYHKLKIPFEGEKLFNVKLKATGLVNHRQSATAYNPEFELNDKGYLVLDKYASYLKYLQKLSLDEIVDEKEIKNQVLKQLNTKDVNISYYFNDLANDTGLDSDIVQACCMEFYTLGYVIISKQEVSITAKGKLFIKTGGYKNGESFGVKIEQIGHRYSTTGDQSPIASNDVNQSFNLKEESVQSLALQEAQLENTRLSSLLLTLQIKEAKTKRKFAVLGAIGGAILTYFSTHLKEIWILIKSLLSI